MNKMNKFLTKFFLVSVFVPQTSDLLAAQFEKPLFPITSVINRCDAGTYYTENQKQMILEWMEENQVLPVNDILFHMYKVTVIDGKPTLKPRYRILLPIFGTVDDNSQVDEIWEYNLSDSKVPEPYQWIGSCIP